MSFEDDSTKLLEEMNGYGETSYDDGDGNTNPTRTFPLTYVVLKFTKNATSECIEWLARRIQGPREEGGAELLARRQPSLYNESGPVILHVSASKIKLLEVAEEMEVRIKDLTGREREFMVTDIDDYIPSGKRCAIEDLFPMSERQRIVHRQLHIAMRALSSEEHIPGHPNIKLNAGESVVQALLREGLLDSQYILHDEDALKKLGPKWYCSIFRTQPLEEIHTYFGEAVTLYFTFLGYYTKALCIPMFLGFLQIVFSTTVSQIFFLPCFCLFNVLWVTIFLQLWKRKCSELAFAWGTIGMTSLDEPRPGFRGELKVDPITNQLLPQYPRWKTNLKMYLVSIPIVLICLAVAFDIMLWYFWLEEYLCRTHWHGLLEPPENPDEESLFMMFLHTALPLLPSTIYTILIYVMNWVYRRFATSLTEWENHRTQSQFDRHRVLKLILFEFVNNFMALFYVAFYLHDMAMLKFQLAMMMILLQIFNNVQEVVLPICISKINSSLRSQAKAARKFVKKSTTVPSSNTKNSVLRKRIHEKGDNSADEEDSFLRRIPCLDEDDPRIQQAIFEGEKDPYEGTYDDYLELFMQFGYVFLFASAYPAAAFWAVLNNVIEIRTDAFKLCHILQRPLAKRVKNTGAWQNAFEAMGCLSVITNCAFLGIFMWKAYSIDTSYEALEEVDEGMTELMASGNSGPLGLSLTEWALVVLAVEHLFLLLQCLLYNGIHDRPEHVRVSLAQQAYCSRQVLKRQKSLLQKKPMKRYNTVHGRNCKTENL